MRRVSCLILVVFGLLAVARPAMGQAAQVFIDCGPIAGGLVAPTMRILFTKTDCPGGPPATITVAFAVPPAGLTAGAKAVFIAGWINGTVGPGVPANGNTFCGVAPAITAVVTGTRVVISSTNAAAIVSLETNDGSQEAGSLKGADGTSDKWMSVDGTVSLTGGTVTLTVNPTVTVTVTPGETGTQIVQALDAALTAAAFPHSLVSLSGSNILDRASIQNAQNTLAIRVTGHPAGFGPDGCWVQSTDSRFRGVSQVDMPGSSVPTLPQWGLIVLAALILVGGGWVILRRARSRPAPA